MRAMGDTRWMIADRTAFNGFAAGEIAGMIKQSFVAIHGRMVKGTGNGVFIEVQHPREKAHHREPSAGKRQMGIRRQVYPASFGLYVFQVDGIGIDISVPSSHFEIVF